MPRCRPSRTERGRSERGAAVVDFVLVSVVLVPLVLGLLQVGLMFYVRSTLTAAATEGARYAATLDRQPGEGVERTRRQLEGVLSNQFVRDVTARTTERSGLPVIEVVVRAEVPPLGLWGPGMSLEVVGHGVVEQAP